MEEEVDLGAYLAKYYFEPIVFECPKKTSFKPLFVYDRFAKRTKSLELPTSLSKREELDLLPKRSNQFDSDDSSLVLLPDGPSAPASGPGAGRSNTSPNVFGFALLNPHSSSHGSNQAINNNVAPPQTSKQKNKAVALKKKKEEEEVKMKEKTARK
eukprot:TRINITY_DN8403_c0_g1_i2.p1 TRINITY_DN8403_c0_g1~~TRINITY_DN8403_c0_g1_i2.p1  ORF type:complete len:156 (+),score=28.06 TRINITY_DN8403_c0_g1_i2:74-541(+)